MTARGDCPGLAFLQLCHVPEGRTAIGQLGNGDVLMEVWVHWASECSLWISICLQLPHGTSGSETDRQTAGLPSSLPSQLFSLTGVGRFVSSCLAASGVGDCPCAGWEPGLWQLLCTSLCTLLVSFCNGLQLTPLVAGVNCVC